MASSLGLGLGRSHFVSDARVAYVRTCRSVFPGLSLAPVLRVARVSSPFPRHVFSSPRLRHGVRGGVHGGHRRRHHHVLVSLLSLSLCLSGFVHVPSVFSVLLSPTLAKRPTVLPPGRRGSSPTRVSTASGPIPDATGTSRAHRRASQDRRSRPRTARSVPASHGSRRTGRARKRNGHVRRCRRLAQRGEEKERRRREGEREGERVREKERRRGRACESGVGRRGGGGGGASSKHVLVRQRELVRRELGVDVSSEPRSSHGRRAGGKRKGRERDGSGSDPTSVRDPTTAAVRAKQTNENKHENDPKETWNGNKWVKEEKGRRGKRRREHAGKKPRKTNEGDARRSTAWNESVRKKKRSKKERFEGGTTQNRRREPLVLRWKTRKTTTAKYKPTNALQERKERTTWEKRKKEP